MNHQTLGQCNCRLQARWAPGYLHMWIRMKPARTLRQARQRPHCLLMLQACSSRRSCVSAAGKTRRAEPAACMCRWAQDWHCQLARPHMHLQCLRIRCDFLLFCMHAAQHIIVGHALECCGRYFECSGSIAANQSSSKCQPHTSCTMRLEWMVMLMQGEPSFIDTDQQHPSGWICHQALAGAGHAQVWQRSGLWQPAQGPVSAQPAHTICIDALTAFLKALAAAIRFGVLTKHLGRQSAMYSSFGCSHPQSELLWACRDTRPC